MSKKLDIAANVTPVENNIHISKTTKEAAKEKLQELIKEESRMVRGIFQNFENPGSAATICVRKYPGIPPYQTTMIDGVEYEVPLYVARFLNGIDASAGALGDKDKRNTNIGTCSYAVHGFKWDKGREAPSGAESYIPGQGTATVVPIIGITKRVKRYGFQSLEFAGAVA
jgi:hypothetical protein